MGKTPKGFRKTNVKIGRKNAYVRTPPKKGAKKLKKLRKETQKILKSATK